MERTWAYIVSPSFSGSTLLTFLLGSHPEIATIGELKATAMGDVDSYDCSCGTRIRACPFWKSVAEEMVRRGSYFDLANFGTHFRTECRSLSGRLLSGRLRNPVFECLRSAGLRTVPGARRTLRRILERNRLLSEVITDIRGGSVFVDGSKDPIRLKHFLDARLWRTKVIYLIRNGLGVANSFMRHYSASMKEAASEWRDTHREIAGLRRRYRRNDWIQIRYEDLCREPNRMLESLFSFLGVQPHLAATEYPSVGQHILGNAMRLRSNDEIRLDERWRVELGVADCRTFDCLAGDLNRAFGYDDRDPASSGGKRFLCVES